MVARSFRGEEHEAQGIIRGDETILHETAMMIIRAFVKTRKVVQHQE